MAEKKARYVSKGESHAERKAAGQAQWAVWLTKEENEAALAKLEAWGVSKSELVRLGLAALPDKPK